MTHDPLCPWAQDGGFDIRGECFLIEGSEPPISACDLIAKVRADELHQIRDTVQQAAQEAAFTPSMDGLFDAVDLIDSMRSDAAGAARQNHNENVVELTGTLTRP